MKTKNHYSLSEFFKNIISLIYTKIFFKRARLIRRPIFIRGKKHFKYGEGLTTGYNCRLEMFSDKRVSDKKIILGKNCKIGDYVHIAAAECVSIGNNVLMGSKILITDLNHGNYSGMEEQSSPDIPPDKRPLQTKAVTIGDNVWLGDNVCILSGVKIGDGCIIGANSVVNKDIRENSIAIGSPAKIIKVYDENTKTWMKI